MGQPAWARATQGAVPIKQGTIGFMALIDHLGEKSSYMTALTKVAWEWDGYVQ